MLKVNELYFSYDNDPVLNGINLDIEKGTFIGIIGPNGSGKSTLIKNMSGYLKPSKGVVLLDGTDINKMSQNQRVKQIGYVPQTAYIDFDFSCEDIVAMGRLPYIKRFEREKKIDLDAIEYAMKTTDTWNMRKKPVTHLSGGERQRVIIAQAICQEPSILLLDEPISHLDIKYQYDIMNLLSRLCHDGMTVVAVLHDLSLASQFCDSLALLKNGKILTYGSAKNVITKENIKSAYGTEIMLIPNPVNGLPIVLPIVG